MTQPLSAPVLPQYFLISPLFLILFNSSLIHPLKLAMIRQEWMYLYFKSQKVFFQHLCQYRYRTRNVYNQKANDKSLIIDRWFGGGTMAFLVSMLDSTR